MRAAPLNRRTLGRGINVKASFPFRFVLISSPSCAHPIVVLEVAVCYSSPRLSRAALYSALSKEYFVSEGTSLPPSEPSVSAALPDANPPRTKSRRTLWIILASVSGVLVLCIVLTALLIGRSILSISTEQAAITPVIDRFMQAMTQHDAQAAYRLFSTRAQRQTPIADLTTLLEGPNYVLFDGYQSVTIDATNLTSAVNTNPDVAQGSVANVNGTVSYTGGVSGSFRATLEKEDGDWRLFYINVTVPPSKMKPTS